MEESCHEQAVQKKLMAAYFCKTQAATPPVSDFIRVLRRSSREWGVLPFSQDSPCCMSWMMLYWIWLASSGKEGWGRDGGWGQEKQEGEREMRGGWEPGGCTQTPHDALCTQLTPPPAPPLPPLQTHTNEQWEFQLTSLTTANTHTHLDPLLYVNQFAPQD